jgi:hypothetical protein
VAVFRGAELVDWELKHFKRRWCSEKEAKIAHAVRLLLERYAPDTLALKREAKYKHCLHIKTLLEQVVATAATMEVEVSILTIEQLQKLPKGQWELVTALVNKFPALSPYNRNRLQFLSRYYHKLFEAVAVAYELTK